MPIFFESESRIEGDVLFDIVSNTNITRTSPGSKARAFGQALAKKLGRQSATFDINMVQAFLSGAEGRYLNFIGGMMNVERLGETSARVSSADRVIRFFTDIGTFGTINGGSSITLPAGTLIGTQPGAQGIQYVLPFTVILASDISEFWVTAESLTSGDNANVGADTLLYHDFNNYTDVVSESLQVTNDAEIFIARDVEGDTNYRFRIANSVLESEKANETAIRLNTLIVPGVADVVLLPFNRGIGTYDLLIKATTPRVPDGLVEAVNESIGKVTAQGIVNQARKPRELGISLVVSLTMRRRLPDAEQTAVIQAVTENIRSYIDNLDIGEEFIVNEIVERVLSTSDDIKNVGAANLPIDSLFIYKPSSLNDNKVRETLIGDYDPEADEKLYVEDRFGGATPILVRIIN